MYIINYTKFMNYYYLKLPLEFTLNSEEKVQSTKLFWQDKMYVSSFRALDLLVLKNA